MQATNSSDPTIFYTDHFASPSAMELVSNAMSLACPYLSPEDTENTGDIVLTGPTRVKKFEDPFARHPTFVQLIQRMGATVARQTLV